MVLFFYHLLSSKNIESNINIIIIVILKGTKSTATSLGWLDPRSLVKLFEENHIRAWIDVIEVGSASSSSSGSLFSDITKGMNQVDVVIACFSDEYAMSKNCALEFRFAHVSLKLPIIKAIVGKGNDWRKNEIGFLAGNYPEINFQQENQGLSKYSLIFECILKIC